MGKLKNLALTGLITLGSLGLFNKGNAQNNRVTKLSSWPIEGISNAKVILNNLEFRTNNQGYVDFLTDVNNENNLEIKLSNIRFNNNVMFDNVGKANLIIYNILGQKVKEINGNNYLTWDLTNNNNEKVAFSSYLYKLEDETKIETGLIIPNKGIGKRNLVVKDSKKNVNKTSLRKESTGNVSVVDTIYCDGRPSTRNLERILMSEFLATKLKKEGGGNVVYNVEKDNTYYCIQDTIESLDKIPKNIQMLEDVDMGKQDGISFLDYIKMLRPTGVINFGDFETNYPVPVFLDSAAIFNNAKIGARAQMYLNTLRNIIKEANDSLKLNVYYEVDRLEKAKVRLDYSSFSHVINHYSKDQNGNWKEDSARVYIDPSIWDQERLTAEGRHEFGHLHVPYHSPYPEDITSLYFSKTYSKADKSLFRVLALAKPGTYWKKFVKR